MTKREQEWLDAVRESGCVVCRLQFDIYSPGVPHHIDGKTKPNAHYRTIGLCFNHHQEGSDCVDFVSRHPHKRRFEARYGSEQELFSTTLDDVLVYNYYRPDE